MPANFLLKLVHIIETQSIRKVGTFLRHGVVHLKFKTGALAPLVATDRRMSGL